jgi:putative transposase
LREAIEGLALEKPPLPLSSVHRQAKQFAEMIGEPAPSYWIDLLLIEEVRPGEFAAMAFTSKDFATSL